MAGKKGMRGGGGPRPGSGRPPKQAPEYDQQFKDAVLRAAQRLERKHGMPIEEAVLSLVYDGNVQDSVRASLFKTFASVFTVNRSRQSVEVEAPYPGPTIYRINDKGERVIVKGDGRSGIWLPEQYPDPAKNNESGHGKKP